MSIKRISWLLLIFTVFVASSIAQETPNDLRGLIGIRASSGEMELQSRGYVFVKTDEGSGRKWSNYWNGMRRVCITVATANGRFDSIVTSPPFDCGRESVGNAGGPPSGVVTVYEDYDMRGRSQTFSDGRYLSNRGMLGNLRNDRASSIDVPIGFSARLCDGEGNGSGAGVCVVFNSGRHNLPFNLDNRTSYVEVSQVLFGGGGVSGGGTSGSPAPGLGQSGVTVYDDRNFRGTSQSFGPGKYLHQAGQFGALRNDEASSVVVLNGFRVRICENEGAYGSGGGRCEEYGAGRYNLRYNDDASFIEVLRASSAPTGGMGGWLGSILPVNVSDLVGVRASSGETEMRNRGFRIVDTLSAPTTRYTIWWRAASRQCMQVATANGRYDSITNITTHPKCY